MPIESKVRAYTVEQKRGLLIKRKRLEKNLTQNEVANWISERYQAKITQQRISKIERGGDLSGNEVFYFADALDIGLEEMSCL